MYNGLQNTSRTLEKLFKNKAPKSDEHYVNMGSKMESKWSQLDPPNSIKLQGHFCFQKGAIRPCQAQRQ